MDKKKKNDPMDQIQSRIAGLIRAVHGLPAKDRRKLMDTVSSLGASSVDVAGQRLKGSELEGFKKFLRKVDAGETSGPPRHDTKAQKKPNDLLATALERLLPEFKREIAAERKKGESFGAKKPRTGRRK